LKNEIYPNLISVFREAKFRVDLKLLVVKVLEEWELQKNKSRERANKRRRERRLQKNKQVLLTLETTEVNNSTNYSNNANINDNSCYSSIYNNDSCE
jgi:hypothetical protein